MEKITPLEAWHDFWQNEKPKVWADLTTKERNGLCQANIDAGEKRISKSGKRIRLGDDRIERFLSRYAPGKYEFYRQIEVTIK